MLILSLGGLLSRAGEELPMDFNSITFGVVEFADQFVNMQNSVMEYFTLEKILSEAKC